MGKPYHKHRCGMNPPENFVSHDRYVREVVGRARGVSLVELTYGYGPCADMVLDVEPGFEPNLVRLLDELRTDSEAHFPIIMHLDEPGFTAAERDELMRATVPDARGA